ncbi:MAG TPA: CAP domain-containing protein [Dehalococcoidia bacterium]|nr:CAP domain-containing protein [Dehalococcoidia bacterium]
MDNSLNNVARWMADDMAHNNYFSHTDSLGRDPFTRMDQLGYTYNTWRGENLVAGTDTAAYAFEMWVGSPGHNANMLSPNYTVIGIARAYSASSSFGWYWATEFGGHSIAPPPAPAAPAPQPAPQPAPPAPQPVQPAPQPAAPVNDEPPPAPTSTPAPATITFAEADSDSRWWESMLLIGTVPDGDQAAGVPADDALVADPS